MLDEDDDARRVDEGGLMTSDESGVLLFAGRSRTSGRCDGDIVGRWASDSLVGVMVACLRGRLAMSWPL